MIVFIFYLNFTKGLFIENIIKLIKHKNARPHGIVSSSVGIILSMFFSLFVQLVNVITSLSSVNFNTYTD